MPRRANHEGTRPRKVKGRELYRVRVMLGGKVHDCYASTSKAAADKARRLVQDWDKGLAPLDPRYTVADWLADWQRLYTANLSPRTVASYADTSRLYIVPTIGKVRLAQLGPDDITKMLATIRGPKGELSATTVRYVYSVLRIALGRAVKVGRLHRNVATLVDPPARSGFRVTPLSTDEADRLRDALVGHRHEALLIVDMACGLREGELLGLTWPAVDLARGTLDIRAQLERGTRLLVEPKRESRRRVDLPPTAVAVLEAHQRAQKRQRVGKLDWDPRDFVFTTPTGQPLSNGTPIRAFQAVLAKAGLPHQRLHDLRHWFATSQIEAGVDLAVVSKLLGHRDISTTSNIYGHLTDEMRSDAAERMEKRLRRRTS